MGIRYLALLLCWVSWAPIGRADDLPWYTERRIIGVSELEPIENASGSVLYFDARVIARMETTEDIGICTSLRVGPDLFLTNHHCTDFKPCDSVQFHLAYERSIPRQDQLILKCKELITKNPTFDYALYRVDPNGTSPKPSQPIGGSSTNFSLDSGDLPPPLTGFPMATLWSGPLQLEAPMFLAGHPGARFKEMDRGEKCKLRTTSTEVIEERQTIKHTCDTEGGSSGSPVMDRSTGYVVALHWGGKDDFNMAIPMSAIVHDLQKNVPPAVFSQLQIKQ